MAPFRLPAALAALAAGLALSGCISLVGAGSVRGLIHAPDRTFDGAPAPAAAVAPVRLDNNRMFVELAFRRPDGGVRRALAWVNTGGGAMTLAPALRAELGAGRPVELEIAGMPVRLDPRAVTTAGAGYFAQALGPMPVEALLPAGVLAQFRVTVDDQAGTLTLERPGDAPAPGRAVPIRVDPDTGLISVAARVDGRAWPLVLDLGGGYSWIEGAVVRGWLDRHPDGYRADGAAGESNQAMVGFAFEQRGVLARLPVLDLGGVQLRQLGVLGSSPARGSPLDAALDHLFWTAWGRSAPEPVVGWIGGNAIRAYRVTIDYRNHVSYWLETAAPRTDDLDSVGVSLIHRTGDYVVGGLVRRAGVVSARGVRVGDRLVAIDGRAADAMTRGEVIGALHGRPGERRRLTLQRGGRTLEVEAPVTAY
jgi:hypothetical protein